MSGASQRRDNAKKQSSHLSEHFDRLQPKVLECFGEDDDVTQLPRPELALRTGNLVTQDLERSGTNLNLLDRRTLVAELIDWLLTSSPRAPAAVQDSEPRDNPEPTAYRREGSTSNAAMVERAKQTVQPLVMERLDLSAASQLPRKELAQQLAEIVKEVLSEEKIRLNQKFRRRILPFFENGVLTPIIDREFPLEEAAEAHSFMESNGNFGKIVLTC